MTWHLRACPERIQWLTVNWPALMSLSYYAIWAQRGDQSHLSLCSSGRWRPPRPCSDPTPQAPPGSKPQRWQKLPSHHCCYHLNPLSATAHNWSSIAGCRQKPLVRRRAAWHPGNLEVSTCCCCKHRDWARRQPEFLSSTHLQFGLLGIQTTWDEWWISKF